MHAFGSAHSIMSFKPSELPLLVSLDVLLEERNVTRAAARLHVSQPALSGQLARLRKLFKDPLLIPSETGRGMVATPKAEEIAPSLRDALARLDAIGQTDVGFDPRVDAATFRIRDSCGTVDVFTSSLLSAIERFDNRTLRVVFHADVDDGDVLAPFESGNIDLLLVSSTRIPPSLKLRELVREPLLLVYRAGHPLGGSRTDIDTYCSLRHVVVSPSGRLDDDMDSHLQRLGQTREVAVCAPNGHTLRCILAGTDMVCTLPRSMAQSLGPELQSHALSFDVPPVTLAMAWHPRLDRHPSHRWLREQIAQTARALAERLHA